MSSFPQWQAATPAAPGAFVAGSPATWRGPRLAAVLISWVLLLATCDSRPRSFGSLLGDAGCQHNDTTYSHTSTACQSERRHRCDNGRWQDLGTHCADQPLVLAKSCGLDGSTYSPGSASCQSGHQYRCDDGVWMNLVAACNHGDIEARMAPDARPCRHSALTVATLSTVCRSGLTIRCEDGEWRDLGIACQ